MPRPTPEQLASDPQFLALPTHEKVKALSILYPKFGEERPERQVEVVLSTFPGVAQQAHQRLQSQGVQLTRDAEGRVSEPITPLPAPPGYGDEGGMLKSLGKAAQGFGETLGVGSMEQAEQTARTFSPLDQGEEAFRAARAGNVGEAFAHGGQAIANLAGPIGGMAFQTLANVPTAAIEEQDKVREAKARGDDFGAFGHTLARNIPIIGPAAANVGEMYKESPAKGVGGTASLLAPFAAGKVSGKVLGRRSTRVSAAQLADEAATRISGYEGPPEGLNAHIDTTLADIKQNLTEGPRRMLAEIDAEATPRTTTKRSIVRSQEPTGIVDEQGRPMTREVKKYTEQQVRDEKHGVWVDTAEWKARAKTALDAMADTPASNKAQLKQIANLPDRIPWDEAAAKRQLLKRASTRFDEPLRQVMDDGLEGALRKAGRDDLADTYFAANRLESAASNAFARKLATTSPDKIADVMFSRSTSAAEAYAIREAVGPEKMQSAVARSIQKAFEKAEGDAAAFSENLAGLERGGRLADALTPESARAIRELQTDLAKFKQAKSLGKKLAKHGAEQVVHIAGHAILPAKVKMIGAYALARMLVVPEKVATIRRALPAANGDLLHAASIAAAVEAQASAASNKKKQGR